jgi:hypothetical protein
VSVDIPKAKNEIGCPVRALKAWLETARITEGPVFRGLRKGDRLTEGRLSDRHVDGIIRRRAGPEYSGHSLRAGWCTAARSGRRAVGRVDAAFAPQERARRDRLSARGSALDRSPRRELTLAKT